MKKASISCFFLGILCILGLTPLAPKSADGLEPYPNGSEELEFEIGDITAVIAGRGLDGGGERGEVTLDVKVPLTLGGPVNRGAVLSAYNRGSGGGVSGSGGTGVSGSGRGIGGKGVYGYSGLGYGVYGKTDSDRGYAGYFEGGQNYFGGDVGIGTPDPRSKLDVKGMITAWGLKGEQPQFNVLNRGDIKFTIDSDDSESEIDSFILYNGARTRLWSVNEKGYMLLNGHMTVEKNMTIKGSTKTDVLVITGGSDIAEPFSISDSDKIPKGAVVVIDEENPGQLKLSSHPYDNCVAGIVSGAGGLNPGLTLSQKGINDGGVNVALNGRVYALADASNEAIKPGDILTTSSIPGHAMKATDRERSYGAVIGKAMSSLDEGRGLVLVLVNLQ